ncbi:MAG TPA: SGNH/GDSL hydrolase family protein [Firmicutes bacterium]|nr:SGNH/GDSL hydrolase family protein [Bacillota bacterium]
MSRKMKAVHGVIGGIIVFFLGLGGYTIHKFNQLPQNTPKNYRFNGNKNRPLVVCVGDSNTQGSLAFNYVEELPKLLPSNKFEFVNAGINGDLAYNVLERIDEIVACQPDYIILMIGSNDIIATLNKLNEMRYERKKHLPIKPNVEWFISNLTEVIQVLKTRTQAKIALVSIPVISEDLLSEPFQRSIKYSEEIRELANREGITYLPLNEQQVEYLLKHHKQPGEPYDSSLLVYFLPAFKHYVLKKSWDDISAERGLSLTVDTVHQNSKAARMLEQLVLSFLEH